MGGFWSRCCDENDILADGSKLAIVKTHDLRSWASSLFKSLRSLSRPPAAIALGTSRILLPMGLRLRDRVRVRSSSRLDVVTSPLINALMLGKVFAGPVVVLSSRTGRESAGQIFAGGVAPFLLSGGVGGLFWKATTGASCGPGARDVSSGLCSAAERL